MKGFLLCPICDWNPVTLPIALKASGQAGVAGAAAPSTVTFAAAPARPVPSATASVAANAITATRTLSLCRRVDAWTSRPMNHIEHPCSVHVARFLPLGLAGLGPGNGIAE